jgi:transcription termination factor Rho
MHGDPRAGAASTEHGPDRSPAPRNGTQAGTPRSPASPARQALYEAAKRADYDIPSLQRMPMAELLQLATGAGVENPSGRTRQDLIFQVLRLKVTRSGLGWGEGVLDILPDGFGFLRSPRYDYRASPDDIYVSPSQIRRLNLRQGHTLAGPVRPPKDGEKYFALLHVEAVGGAPVQDLPDRIPFEDLTPLLPRERLHLAASATDLDLRLIDLLAPMGKGQRTLLMAPPHAMRLKLLTRLTQALIDADPDLYVILVLCDERPEEVTEAIRATGPDDRREVVASSFDEATSHHTALASMALEKARRLVEGGRDVALVVDSLTQLVRAWNTELPGSGKMLSAGLDAAALEDPKRLFGAARNVEEGGSLTVIATVLTDTDSQRNDVICEEFRGRGNCEIVLDADLAATHLYPAIDVHRTGTRREDLLLDPIDIARLQKLRARFAGKEPRAALEELLADLERFETNRAYLDSLDG